MDAFAIFALYVLLDYFVAKLMPVDYLSCAKVGGKRTMADLESRILQSGIQYILIIIG